MKKLIGIAAFVTIGLFCFAHEAPPAQADKGTLSSRMENSEFAAVVPGCTPSRPFCFEFDPDGICTVCVVKDGLCP
jgi:hypothetical protein